MPPRKSARRKLRRQSNQHDADNTVPAPRNPTPALSDDDHNISGVFTIDDVEPTLANEEEPHQVTNSFQTTSHRQHPGDRVAWTANAEGRIPPNAATYFFRPSNTAARRKNCRADGEEQLEREFHSMYMLNRVDRRKRYSERLNALLDEVSSFFHLLNEIIATNIVYHLGCCALAHRYGPALQPSSGGILWPSRE